MRVLTYLAPLVIASALAVQSPAQTPNPATAPRGSADNGKKIYTTHGCYQCHNYAAHGGGAGPRIAPRPIVWPAFSKLVREPKDQMPPYSAKILSDQELADIYAFLLTIPAPPSVDSIPILKP